MKTFSTFLQDRLLSNYSQAYFAVKLDLGAESVRVTTLPYQGTIKGEVYSTSPPLLSVAPPRYSGVLDRAPYQLEFSDPEGELEATLSAQGYGAEVTVYLGFYDPETSLPERDDLLMVYQGNFDTMTKSVSDRGHVLTVQATSPLGALDATNSVYTSKSWVNSINPADTSMDAVAATSASELRLYWGKT